MSNNQHLNSAKVYLNRLLRKMIEESTSKFVARKSAPLPSLASEHCPDSLIPSWEGFRNRLKCVCGLDPSDLIGPPITGKFPVIVKIPIGFEELTRSYNIHVVFDDCAMDPFVALVVEYESTL